MKEYEVLLYEEFCKRCKSLAHCPWRCLSGDTCFEMVAFEAYGEMENDNECKEEI